MKVIIFIKDILAISLISGLAKPFDNLPYKVQKKLKLIVKIYRAYYSTRLYFSSIFGNFEPPSITEYFYQSLSMLNNPMHTLNCKLCNNDVNI